MSGPAFSRRDLLAAVGLELAAAGPLARGQSQQGSAGGLPQPDGFDRLKPTGVPDEAYWRAVRGEFRLRDDLAFLNTGTCGPVPRAVLEVHERYDRELAQDPSNNFREAELSEVRKRLAGFVNAAPQEIALTHSTTEGLNLFAHGLEWKDGDEAVLGSEEHFSAHEAYLSLEKRCGVRIVWVEIPARPESVDQVVGLYAKEITPRTRVLVVSEVSYLSGLRAPIQELARLAHGHSALISVDGAQSFGVVPLDVRAAGIDHYAGPGQKWLLAGTGTGFSYLRKDLHNSVFPLAGYVDSNGVGGHGAPAGNRYERGGQVNIPASLGVAAAVDFQNAIGKGNIWERARQLTAQLRQGLKKIPGTEIWTPSEPELSAAITVFTIERVPAARAAAYLLERAHVRVRQVKPAHGDAVRISTHFFNSPEEIERALSGVRDFANGAKQAAL